MHRGAYLIAFFSIWGVYLLALFISPSLWTASVCFVGALMLSILLLFVMQWWEKVEREESKISSYVRERMYPSREKRKEMIIEKMKERKKS